MAKTNWDPYSGTGPPPPPPPRSLVNQNTKPKPPLLPPPSRTSSSASTSLSRGNSISPAPPLPSRSSSASSGPPAPPPRGTSPALPNRSLANTAEVRGFKPPTAAPPPIRLSTRPDARPPQSQPSEANIDWANLSPEDKQVFFGWLDEFFANFKPANGSRPSNNVTLPPSHTAPPLKLASKPISSGPPVSTYDQSTFSLSHPPSTQYGSAALDLAHYFAPTTPWDVAWYNASDTPAIPPPIEGSKELTYVSSWRQQGSNKSTSVGIFFSDLSIFWGTVDFSTFKPEDPRSTKRHAAYLPPPQPLTREQLVEAHETYGDTIALYAESFLGSGNVCGRGECWDLANEGLKYFNDYDYVPKPVPSISRTHGHLIYEGRASNGGRLLEGRWRGGDDRIRRGDIAEWRKVRIGQPGGRGHSILGDPDHTAVIVADSQPKSTPRDGESLSPSELGILAVIEQSQGQLPERREYHPSCLEEGEMWIYRPIGMEVYLGVSNVSPTPPQNHPRLERL